MATIIDQKGFTFPRRYLEQYCGLWAMDERTFGLLAETARATDLAAHVAENQVEGWEPLEHDLKAAENGQFIGARHGFFLTEDGIAIISMIGTMTKHGTSLSESSATTIIRRKFRNATMDSAVKGILFRIDSPGGTVAGTADLGDAVKAAAAVKPVHAFIEDIGASAAFWVASQASRIFANRMAMVGSIGTFGVLFDSSQMAEKEGVKVLVFRAGDFKGAGTPGTEITEAQQKEFQRLVDGANAHFIKAISTGRKMLMADVRAIADGRAHEAKDALKMGLIDGISSFDDVLRSLGSGPAQDAGDTNKGRRRTMSSDEKAPQTEAQEGVLLEAGPLAATQTMVASIDEIKAACPGADAGFIVVQLENKATVDQAQKAYIVEQSNRLEAQKKETEAAQTKADRPGVEALGDGKTGAKTSDGLNPIDGFNAAIAEKVKGGLNKVKAIEAVVYEQPELHEAYLEAVNPPRSRRR